MSTLDNLNAVEDWNITTGCALDDQGKVTRLLSITLKLAAGAPAATATLVFQGERGGPGIGSLMGADLNVQPDPSDFAHYLSILSAGRAVGAYVALDDKNQLLSFFLSFSGSR